MEEEYESNITQQAFDIDHYKTLYNDLKKSTSKTERYIANLRSNLDKSSKETDNLINQREELKLDLSNTQI